MLLNNILLFVAVIAVVNVLVFYASPQPFVIAADSINPANLLLFQVSHFDVMHLLENLLGMVFTGALAIELDMRPSDFALAYFVGIFVAIPLLFIFPGAVVAGNSTGIFGALGATLFKARKMISAYVTFPLAALFIFSITLVSIVSGAFALSAFNADFFHFAGFLAGAAISISISKNKLIRGVNVVG
jgi:membrane associated rhomboid family serine protease